MMIFELLIAILSSLALALAVEGLLGKCGTSNEKGILQSWRSPSVSVELSKSLEFAIVTQLLSECGAQKEIGIMPPLRSPWMSLVILKRLELSSCDAVLEWVWNFQRDWNYAIVPQPVEWTSGLSLAVSHIGNVECARRK